VGRHGVMRSARPPAPDGTGDTAPESSPSDKRREKWQVIRYDDLILSLELTPKLT